MRLGRPSTHDFQRPGTCGSSSWEALVSGTSTEYSAYICTKLTQMAINENQLQ